MKKFFPVFLLAGFMLASCGTSVKTFSTDPKIADEIMRGSEDRIAKITFDDSTSEYGSRIVIADDFTEWTIADVARRTFNETVAFRPSDSWRIVEGTKRRKAATKTIASILIPSDRAETGMIIGGVVGIGIGAGLAYGFTSAFNTASNPGLSTFAITYAALFGITGVALGGQIGSQHETKYIRISEIH